uniref:Uncharacterized protein n=1 Tax=Meloidogyne enterolobii TaxID=390850 RepID=A0A6V7WVE5_MELEN|nr:unnamed protein product [Meloidogyne enterolobii]CAD2190980.1 unnamed protein product [Meloidogyne enterolobii]
MRFYRPLCEKIFSLEYFSIYFRIFIFKIKKYILNSEMEGHPELPTNSVDSLIGDDELRMFHGPVSLGGLIDALEAYEGSPVILLQSGLRRQLFIYKRPIGTCIQKNNEWILDPPFDHPLRNVQIAEAVANCEAEERTRVDYERMVLIRKRQAARADRLRPRVAARVGQRVDFTVLFASGRDLIVQWYSNPPENQNGNNNF